MRISMIPSNDVKTIHASQNDTQREWSFEPFDNSGTLIIGEESLANIKRIKGNTLAFNQLVKYTNHANATVCGLTITNNNNGSFKINGTYNASGDRNMYGYISIIQAVSGHKYLVKSTGSLMGAFVYGSASGNRDATTYIVTANSSGNMETAIRLIDSKANNGQVVNETIWVNIFDLTQMFGQGKEPTVEQFRALFPLPYYSYQSTLLPFKGTGIKTVGKNLLPKMTPSVVNGITWTVNEDGTVVANGTASANADAQLTVEFTLLEGNYYFNGCPDGGNDGSTWNCYVWDLTTGTRAKQWDKTSNVLNNTNSAQSRQFYSNGTNRYAYNCRVMRGQTVSNLVFKPMVRLSSADDVYEPYTSSTTNLPTLTYFPNGMKSAGNVYDELLPNKAITRVGMVDLGSLDWNYVTSWGSGNVFSSVRNLTDVKTVALSQVPNMLSSRYITVSRNDNYSNYTTGSISMNDQGTLQIRDSSYTSASTFKSAMNGVYLFYELKTPTETDINTEVFYPVYQYGTEQILPINGVNPTTSPFSGDIYYADGLKTDQTFLYRQTPINYNTRQFALVSKNTQTPLTLKDGKGYCNTPLALTNESGFFDAKLKMTDSDGVCYSEKFQIHVERKP